MSQAGADAIRVDGLSKTYGSVHALNSLTLHVPRGVIAGFVGPNGSGKTTTIRTLLGLVRATSGSATVLGLPISHPRAYTKRVGALIESPVFYPTLSGYSNLSTLAILGGHDRKRIPALLEMVGLMERGRDNVRNYSLGMKQRLGIAAALLSDPELLILDEPANGLDPPGIIEMRDLVRRLRDDGKTLFISSHLLGEVDQIADWLIVLKDGQSLYCGPAKDLPGRQAEEIIVQTETAEQLEIVAKIARDHGYTVVSGDNELHLDAPKEFAGELNRLAVNAGAVVTELHRRKATLEATFLQMISEDN